MSTEIGKKIREIREAEIMGRAEFSELTGIPKSTLIHVETGKHEPKAGLVEAVCNAFPHYMVWLMSKNSMYFPSTGQVSPKFVIGIRDKFLSDYEHKYKDSIKEKDLIKMANEQIAKSLAEVRHNQERVESLVDPDEIEEDAQEYIYGFMTDEDYDKKKK